MCSVMRNLTVLQDRSDADTALALHAYQNCYLPPRAFPGLGEFGLQWMATMW